MSNATAKADDRTFADSDLLAIRAMMREEKAEKRRPERRAVRPPQKGAFSKKELQSAAASEHHHRMDASQPRKSSAPSVAGQWVSVISQYAYRKIRAYRPDRKSIFWTSLVLLLLLRPGLVIGWSFVAALAVLLLYLFMGPDRFWRWVILRFQRFSRRHPAPARRIKCRAYVLARKWDSLLRWAPQGLADQLRSPDLREMILSEKRHAAIMAERLTQLERDVPVR